MRYKPAVNYVHAGNPVVIRSSTASKVQKQFDFIVGEFGETAAEVFSAGLAGSVGYGYCKLQAPGFC